MVTARDEATVADLVELAPDRVLGAASDVTDPARAAAVSPQAEDRFGAVDVLVNSAGYGYRAAVEEAEDADVRALFETHFFGSVTMIKAVLPGMRARRADAIVNVSSIGAHITPPGSGCYAAAKAALEGMSGSLRDELRPLGISVTVVEPGGFRTDFSGRSLTRSRTVIDDHAETAGRRRKEQNTTHGTQPGDPARAGRAILTAVESADPPAMLLLGSDALTSYRRVLGTALAEADEWEELSVSTDFQD